MHVTTISKTRKEQTDHITTVQCCAQQNALNPGGQAEQAIGIRKGSFSWLPNLEGVLVAAGAAEVARDAAELRGGGGAALAGPLL